MEAIGLVGTDGVSFALRSYNVNVFYGMSETVTVKANMAAMTKITIPSKPTLLYLWTASHGWSPAIKSIGIIISPEKSIFQYECIWDGNTTINIAVINNSTSPSTLAANIGAMLIS